MIPDGASLSELRREIDRIDTAIHDLLVERTRVVEEVGRAKDRESGGAPRRPFRPAREAQVLRELVERHRGPFPAASLIRIWREIMSGMTRIQGEFSVATLRAETSDAEDRSLWDAARDHFGLGARYRAYGRASQVLAAIDEGEATVGVLPMPSGGEARPWWPHLIAERPDGLAIVGRLPMLVAPGDRPQPRQLVVTRGPAEPSGADTSFLAIETRVDTSTGTVRAALGAAGLEPERWHEAPNPTSRLMLVEVGAVITEGDTRLGALRNQAGNWLVDARPIGLCPQPIVVEDNVSPPHDRDRS